MPVWIPEYLSKNKTESSDAQTLYIDLPKNEQISFLHLELSMQGVATPRTTTTFIDKLSNLEVLADGQSILYSLPPEIALYVDFISRGGVYPPCSWNYTPLARETMEFIIPFGRYPYDPEYFLSTSLYNSVQLQIPYSTDGTHFTSGTFRHNIVMYRPLNKLSPRGFIRSRVHKTETSNAAVETLEHSLPTRYPLRYVGVRVEDLDQNITTDVTAIKVNLGQGRLILADLNINEWRDMDKKRWPEKSYYQIVPAATNETYVKAHTDYPYPRALFSSGVRALIFKLYAAMGEQFALNVYEQDGTAASGGHAVTVQVGGPNPHKCLTLIDGRDEPLNVRDYSEGQIEYTLAEYTSVLHTFVQEVVSGAVS